MYSGLTNWHGLEDVLCTAWYHSASAMTPEVLAHVASATAHLTVGSGERRSPFVATRLADNDFARSKSVPFRGKIVQEGTIQYCKSKLSRQVGGRMSVQAEAIHEAVPFEERL